MRAARTKHNKATHHLRDAWRLAQLRLCLAGSRRDAVIARREHLRVDANLLKRLREVAKQLDGHGLGVTVGGTSTDARWCPASGNGLRE